MTEEELAEVLANYETRYGSRIRTHRKVCWMWADHAECTVTRLVAEVRRLRQEVAELREQLAGQKAINLRLAERLRACSEVLGKAAERGRVCECEVTETRRAERVLVTPAGPDHNQPHKEGLTDG